MLRPVRLMGLFLVLCSPSELMGAKQITLKNSDVEVVFEETEKGPRLAALTAMKSGKTYLFEESGTLGLALVDPADLNDPGLVPSYRKQEGFRFLEARENNSGEEVVFRFEDDGLEVSVKYELRGPLLRKTISCSALKADVYVAGILHWNLGPSNLAVLWPLDEQILGQPIVFKGAEDGFWVTLEWPRALHTIAEDGRAQLSCRPGFNLAAGESKELTAGAIGLFEHANDDSILEAARQSFFSYITDRLKPKFPFPVKFTTWGPWLGQAREDRILEILDDLAYVGADLFHFDAGWQWPDYPYSERMPRVFDADNETWDLNMTLPERLPNGLLPIARELRKRGLKLSLWNDANGSVFIRETEDWAVRDGRGDVVTIATWEGRWPEAAIQSLAYSPYADHLFRFSMDQLERYDLGGIMFDNNRPQVRDYGLGRGSLASGWNSPDVSMRTIWGILEEAERRRPGIYRFLCMARPWPWNLKYTTHIHAGDPGTSNTMKEAAATDFPARALVYERYLAWRDLYQKFVPPWGIKGDVAGWSVQQASAIPINLDHTEQVIGSGEGWTYNMMLCFAITAVRDIRFAFRQMPAFDKKVLKEWLAWDRQRSQLIRNSRIISDPADHPNEGIVGISHVGSGQGVVYLFNRSFDLEQFTLSVDESAGFMPGDTSLAANIVYPMNARLASGTVSYGQRLQIPIMGKDCVVIEFGLHEPEDVKPFENYRREAERVTRSYDTLFQAPMKDFLSAVVDGKVRLEVGDHSHDQILAKHIVDAVGGAIGYRIKMKEWKSTSTQNADVRVIIGTHEGLKNHPDLAGRFQERLYSRYVEWDGDLISAPLFARLESNIPTYCLIAPRSDQLARLAIDLVAEITADAEQIEALELQGQYRPESTYRLQMPSGKLVLKFKPVVASPLWSAAGKRDRHTMIPGDLGMIRFEIEVEKAGQKRLLWAEDVAPFYGPPWWDHRIVPLADLTEEEITLVFRSHHINGIGDHRIQLGYEDISIVRLPSSIR